MSGNISLTASMRSNLLSLQNISRTVGATQNKLATGNKVNSAIDNPSSYYTARSLNNRANDLDALLDSMGQAVSTIKTATTALETGATFLEQAAAVATSALETAKIPSKEWFESQDNVSAVVSNWSELKAALDSGKAGNIVVFGNIVAEDTITLKSGQNLVGVGYYGVSEPDTDKFSQISIDLEKLGVTDGIKAQADNLLISDISIKAVTRKSVESRVVNLISTSNHILQNIDILMDNREQDRYALRGARSCAVMGGENISFYKNNSIAEVKASAESCHTIGIAHSQIHVYGQLNMNMLQQDTFAIGATKLNVENNAVLNIVSRGRGIDSSVSNFNGNSVVNINAELGLVYGTHNINDKATVNIMGRIALHSIISEGINYPLTLNINSNLIELNIDSPITFRNNENLLDFNAVSGSQMSVNGKVYKANGAVSDNTMTGNNMPAGYVEVAGAVADPIPSLDWLKEQNANRNMGYDYKNEAEKSGEQYTEILNQYDTLVKDSSYKGVNLLKNEKLNVRFNEKGNADLNVNGKDMSVGALGLNTVDWQNQGDIAQSLKEIAGALKSIRAFTAELGNNYSIITNRQEFTENLINILTEGADKLTLADMNEESANMLSLQTRQQLAINSLSLASQAAQAVLKLF